MAGIIDIHPHIISTDEKRYPHDPLFGKQSDWSKERPVEIEDMIEQMSLANVDKAAIVQASTCYGHDNSYVTDACLRFPNKTTAVCSADFVRPDAIERIKHWQSRGMTGLRLFTGGSTAAFDPSWIDDPRSFPAWDYAAQHEIPVCLQMPAEGFPRAVNILRRFPRVRLLLDHCSFPELKDGPPYNAAGSLFALAAHPNVYLKVTPWVFKNVVAGKATPETFFTKLFAEFGASRLAWGSNYPNSPGTLAEILATAQAGVAAQSESDRAWFFGKTALTLYPSLADK